jgi:hypothetical protein
VLSASRPGRRGEPRAVPVDHEDAGRVNGERRHARTIAALERAYRELEAGELHITNDLYERIVELCGWPR